MLVLIVLFFALPILGVVALIRVVGERSSDPTLHPSPSNPSGTRLRPH